MWFTQERTPREEIIWRKRWPRPARSEWLGLAGDTCAARMRSVVIGRVVASAYMGQDGKPKAPLEVTAESVRFLGGKNGNGVLGAAQGEAEIEIDEEEIPFVRKSI